MHERAVQVSDRKRAGGSIEAAPVATWNSSHSSTGARCGNCRDLRDNDAIVRSHPREKTGRNDPCPCGSGKKFKRCCNAAEGAPDISPWKLQRAFRPDLDAVRKLLNLPVSDVIA